MAKEIPEKKVFCTDCPCRNTDYEQGSTCNVGSDIEFKKIGDEFFHISDDCILDVIRYADGDEFRPTLRATDAEDSAASQAVSNADNLSNSDGSAVTTRRS